MFIPPTLNKKFTPLLFPIPMPQLSDALHQYYDYVMLITKIGGLHVLQYTVSVTMLTNEQKPKLSQHSHQSTT